MAAAVILKGSLSIPKKQSSGAMLFNQEFRERVRDGFKNPDDFIKLSEIEKMGRELSLNTQKLYLEETTSLLNDIDESLLIRKKNRVQRKRDKSYPFTTRSSKYHNDHPFSKLLIDALEIFHYFINTAFFLVWHYNHLI